MKVIVIGCTHAGTAAIVNIRQLYPDVDITVYEKNDNISFLSCGIALYVEGIVKNPEGLFYNSPENLASIGVKTRMLHEVNHVDLDNKKIQVKSLETGTEFEDTYDKLVITTGSWPIVPPIEGVELENIQLSKNYRHSNVIIEKAKTAKHIVVVGAGYIGIELVEAFRENDKNVTLIDSESRILNKYLDKEFTDIAEHELAGKGAQLALGEKVIRFEGEDGKVRKVITDKNAYDADLVILSTGFRPVTDLFKGKLETLDNGAIIVDEYMRTSREDVFAAGDSSAVVYNPTGKHEYIPLATNAVRMGALVAKNLVKPVVKYIGTQGTSGIKIYDYKIAATGLTEQAAAASGIEYQSVTITENDRPEFMPTYEELLLKIVYAKDTRQIIGGQIISKADLTQSINTISIAIQSKLTIDELAFVDFFFQPHFNKPWNFLNTAGLKAE